MEKSLNQYTRWLSESLPADLREELENIKSNDEEIYDRFCRDMTFGTSGLRGRMGAGTCFINSVVLKRATMGIADYVLERRPHPALAISYDTRRNSREYAQGVAEVLSARGIDVWIMEEAQPVPLLSFAVRWMGLSGGIMITASHNPKEYNGYKVYWQDGAQISGAVSDGILAGIRKLDLFDDFGGISLEEGEKRGLLTMLGEETDRAYLDYVYSMRQRPDEELDKSVSVVYTPLNGAGSIPMDRLAKELGYTDFHIVPEQRDPDPEFTTVGYPNPEDPKGFELAEKLGRETGAEVLIATDPDSDRMAIEIPDGRGGYEPLNGNQTGALLIS